MTTPVKNHSPQESSAWADLGTAPTAARPLQPGGSSSVAESGVLTFLQPAQSASELGRLGAYRVLRLLGQGGMGMVLEAENTPLQRRVALKVMLPKVAANKVERERFLHEALAMAKIKSDYVVTVYHAEVERGVPYVEMELLDGQSLAQMLRHGPLLPMQVAQLGRDMALGLAAAHAHSLIHRDIKPGNVWLEPIKKAQIRRPLDQSTLSVPPIEGELPLRAKLLDFGLARATAGDMRLTQTGTVVGTPAYMAPEQARNYELTHQADLFSLGVVLYEACTGRLPFNGEDSLSVMIAIATEPAKPLHDLRPGLPHALADLIMRMLEKQPQLRPDSAQDVADELQRILFSELPSEVDIAPIPLRVAPPTAIPSRADAATSLVRASRVSSGKRKKQKPAPVPTPASIWATIAVIALVLLALVIGGFGLWALGSRQPPTPQTVVVEPTTNPVRVVIEPPVQRVETPLDWPADYPIPPGWRKGIPPPWAREGWQPGDPPPWAQNWKPSDGRPPMPPKDWKMPPGEPPQPRPDGGPPPHPGERPLPGPGGGPPSSTWAAHATELTEAVEQPLIIPAVFELFWNCSGEPMATLPPDRTRSFEPQLLPATIDLPPESIQPSAALPVPAPLLTVPTIPGYTIEHELGRGGMGVVYRAEQDGLKRTVALKMVLAGAHAHPDQLQRFLAEAAIIARLKHCHIVEVYDFGHANGLPYFSLEYCGAGALDAKLNQQSQNPQWAAEILLQLANGMACAHAAGIIHRDLKPSNVLLIDPNTVKITDFGLAKQVDQALTASDTVIGTASYMAPEQTVDAAKVGPTADIYSLGAILYEMLTGRPPLRGANVAVTLALVQGVHPDPIWAVNASVPKDLAKIAHKCLEKRPRDRYQSAEELATDLRRWQKQRTLRIRTSANWKRRSGTKNPALLRSRFWPISNVLLPLVLIVLLLLLALVVGGMGWWALGSRPTTAPHTVVVEPTTDPVPVVVDPTQPMPREGMPLDWPADYPVPLGYQAGDPPPWARPGWRPMDPPPWAPNWKPSDGRPPMPPKDWKMPPGNPPPPRCESSALPPGGPSGPPQGDRPSPPMPPRNSGTNE